MQQLGKALSILIRAQRFECEMHEDVAAWHAPSECHALVAKGEGKRMRFARRRAEHAAGMKMRDIRRRCRRLMGNDAPIYRRYGFVPY